ncbi:MAG: hypothetical protein ABIJ34_03590 [archaeon]
MDISNKTLAFIVFFTILLSVFSTITTLNRISKAQSLSSLSGKALSDQASVQLTIASEVGIILLNDTIDFGSGYVNDTCPIANGQVLNATLIAGATYNDSRDKDCWTASETPTSLHIENIGNLDLLLKVLGPTNDSFFSIGGVPYSKGKPHALLFKARNYETDACDGGTGSIQSTWTDFGGTNKTICLNFTSSSTRDEMAIDIQVVIPVDLDPGTYTNSSITFMAATS